MYLYLGEQVTIRSDEIIGIFDLENTSVSKATRDLLAKAEKNAQVINVTEKLPKSFVLCDSKGKNGKRRTAGGQKVYILQMSAATMYKRSGYVNRLAERMLEDNQDT